MRAAQGNVAHNGGGVGTEKRANFIPLPPTYICLLGKVSLQDAFIKHKSACLSLYQ